MPRGRGRGPSRRPAGRGASQGKDGARRRTPCPEHSETLWRTRLPPLPHRPAAGAFHLPSPPPPGEGPGVRGTEVEGPGTLPAVGPAPALPPPQALLPVGEGPGPSAVKWWDGPPVSNLIQVKEQWHHLPRGVPFAAGAALQGWTALVAVCRMPRSSRETTMERRPTCGTEDRRPSAHPARTSPSTPEYGPDDFPGCVPFHLPANELERYEGRLEFWDGRTRDRVAGVRAHDHPARRADQPAAVCDERVRGTARLLDRVFRLGGPRAPGC